MEWDGMGWDGMTALRTINVENLPLTTTNCQELWKNGRTYIRLSNEEIMISVEKGKRQEKYQQQYLHGSYLNDRYECKPAHGFSNGGNIFKGLNNQYSKKLSHEVIRVDLEIQLNKINGILDIKSNKISIPKAGISTDIKSVIGGIANLRSRDYGRLVIDYKELRDNNCMAEIISDNNGIIYTSKKKK